MLEKTSGVLTRAGIDSLAGLEERLYEELAGVTIADLLNRAVGQFFANAQNAISMVSIRSGSTEQQARAEKHRIIFSGKGPVEQVHPLHLTYKTDRPKKPAFLDISRNGRALMFSKNLLGSFVGDLFTVNGIYAGADNELGHPMASVLGQSYYNGLTTPL
ncbi:MAG: hypothetical protein HY515_04750, partial [Candidatus Aenigmarchaeota archaeon]|nr:hypothetical protein [Candidatus Aenigmarchaeota archaeon]